MRLFAAAEVEVSHDDSVIKTQRRKAVEIAHSFVWWHNLLKLIKLCVKLHDYTYVPLLQHLKMRQICFFKGKQLVVDDIVDVYLDSSLDLGSRCSIQLTQVWCGNLKSTVHTESGMLVCKLVKRKKYLHIHRFWIFSIQEKEEITF